MNGLRSSTLQRQFKLLKGFIVLASIGVAAGLFFGLNPGKGPGTYQASGRQDAAPSPAAQGKRPAYALGLQDNWPPLVADAPDGQQLALVDAQAMTRANYYLILDGSGSMNDEQCSAGRRKIQVAVDAVTAFARALPPHSQFGLATFINGKNYELSALGQQPQIGLGQLSKLRPSGNTPLLSAVNFGYGRLLQQARRQSGYGEYHLVIVTDGMHSKGEDPTPAVDRLIAKSPVVLHSIGFCIDPHHPLNQPGRSYYRSATDPSSLQQGLEAVLAEAPSFDLDRFEP
jgi:hypothetical protein